MRADHRTFHRLRWRPPGWRPLINAVVLLTVLALLLHTLLLIPSLRVAVWILQWITLGLLVILTFWIGMTG